MDRNNKGQFTPGNKAAHKGIRRCKNPSCGTNLDKIPKLRKHAKFCCPSCGVLFHRLKQKILEETLNRTVTN